MSAIVRVEATLSLTRRLAGATGKDKPATPEMFDQARRLVDQFAADLAAGETMMNGDGGNKALDAALLAYGLGVIGAGLFTVTAFQDYSSIYAGYRFSRPASCSASA